jgi:lipid-binding SYLF domain-containing protein
MVIYEEMMMNKKLRLIVLVAALGVPFTAAFAGRDSDTATLFRNANQSAEYFSGSYGYAVFPTIGKGGLGIGAAHGSGHVYSNGRRVGHVTMNQLSVGFQAGGEAYSEIIFFRDKAAMDFYLR